MYTYPNQTTVSTRELAWNKAGTNLDTGGGNLHDGNMTAHQALELGGLLNWNVRKVELTSNGDTLADCGVKFPGKWGVIRDDADSGPVGLGVVGDQYKIFQNEDTIDFLQTIVDEGGANFVASGYMGEGQKTFAVLKMPEGLTVAGQDSHDFYIGAMNKHDGSGKFEVWTTMLRTTCTNVLNPSLKSAPSRFGVRHSGNLEGKIAKARESLEISFAWAEEFRVDYESLLAAPFNKRQFMKMVDELEPESTSKHEGWISRQQERRDTLVDLFTKADTNEFGRGTRYGAYNAFVEYGDWLLPVKGADDAGTLRAARQIDGANADKFKQDAWDYLVTV